MEDQAGPKGTNVYRITVACPDDCDRTPNHRGGEARFTGGVKSSSPLGVKPASPEPSLEPSLKPVKKATRLSEDWKPSEELIAWCQETHPNVDWRTETEHFVDYWLAKPSNAMKLDWERTWKSWMRRVAQRATPARTRRRTAAEENWDIVQRLRQGAING